MYFGQNFATVLMDLFSKHQKSNRTEPKTEPKGSYVRQTEPKTEPAENPEPLHP